MDTSLLARTHPLTFGFGPGYCMGSELARQEMAIGLRARLHQGAFQDCLGPDLVPRDRACVVCLHPFWGQGFSFEHGLDLRRTDPPTADILRVVRRCLPGYRLIFVHHIHERMVEDSVAAVTRGYEIHVRGVTRGSPPSMNTGYIICSPGEE